MDTENEKEPRTRGIDFMPIFVHSLIDDLNLSLGAFRVYGHLARRSGTKNKKAWPSYNTIGEVCFRGSYPKALQATLRRKAIAAVKELKNEGLITVESRKIKDTAGNMTNHYQLVKLEDWLEQKQVQGDFDE